jgi:type IV secretory pathway VirB4 component
MKDITPIGKTDWRNQNQPFGIKDKDRLGHIYAIGKTGTGKSTLLMNMAISDIERGNGLCVIDPHGDLTENILNYIPENRIKDVIYFNATDTEFPIGFNPLHAVHPNYHNLVTLSLISTFKKIWSES